MSLDINLYTARKFLLLLTAVILFIIPSVNTYSQSFKTEKIIYSNQELRDVAKKYFGDPNLWEVILKYNQVNSPSNLHEGMVLILPVGIVNNTISLINETNFTIKKASENGAKIFMPELFNSAIQKLTFAIQEKDDGNWQSANTSIRESLRLAKESLEQSQLLRNQSADATISFRKGDVQNRKASQQIWSDAKVFTKLYEEDRARTLSESFAEITFIDLSRIRLNENSQALIKRSRVDLLKNETETTVKFIKGDAFAYLLKSPKKKFDIDVPGLDSKIQSKSFWIEKEDASTKIANYEGQIELKARDSLVVVKENQGSMIPTGGLPSKPMDLLPSPILNSPINEQKFYSGNAEFSWQAIDNAKQYWFEIAEDQSFKKLVHSNRLIFKTLTSINSLPPGVYYWHVASIDEFGFPGKFGNYNYFIVLKDDNNPYLRIKTPDNQCATRNEYVIIEGETEPTCRLTINGSMVDVAGDGTFKNSFALNDGFNRFNILVTDEAGNKTIASRSVIYELNPDIYLRILSPNYDSTSYSVFSNSSDIYLTGKTRPFSQIDVSTNAGINYLKAYADSNGLFSYRVKAEPSVKMIFQKIESPAGYTRSDSILVKIDMVAPEIEILKPLPSKTSVGNLTIEGKCLATDSLLINGKSINLTDGVFKQNISLIEGINNISITAKDIAGNRSELNKTIVLDTTPPELINYKILNMPIRKNVYTILVRAKDNTEMKKIASAVISVKGALYEHYLKLNKNNYETTITITGENTAPQLISVTLEDYLNNKKEYLIK